jgi:hypothetical protein
MSHKFLLDTGGKEKKIRPLIYGGEDGVFPQGGISKKIPLPSAVAKYLEFLPRTIWKFLQHMPKPPVSSTLLMDKDQFVKGGSSRNARTY